MAAVPNISWRGAGNGAVGKFLAGKLSLKGPLCYIFPQGMMDPDKGKMRETKSHKTL